eukprot:TRINITY_DN617_c0_g1_i15.p2 TRINITY_DN617_c0_g1~~TRINITY_DN617_c0_g1_i15.p2  ORF type:complete len:108 (-),score=2.63 TRINITY_DN617_c0_g1_i15:341-664(-)
MILKSQSCPAELLKQTDKFQNTALHLAMYGSSTELIQLLLDAGVDAEVRNKVSSILLSRSKAKLPGNWPATFTTRPSCKASPPSSLSKSQSNPLLPTRFPAANQQKF